MNTETLPANADLDMSSLSANMCAELAAGLSDVAGIKKRYNVSDEQWNRLRKSQMFRGMLKEAIRRFSGDLNAGKRITLKSEIALEDSIPLLHKWAHDTDVAISNRLDSIKQMTVLAGRTARDAGLQGGPAGPGFSINIIVKGNKKTEELIVATSTPMLEAMDGELADSSET